MKKTVTVVGGGTVGLTVAWTLARRGGIVTVVDSRPGSGASWVAGGMIAPYSEAWPGEEELNRLGVESLGLWDAFARDLQPYADGLLITSRGTVHLAVDEGDAADLETVAAAIGDSALFAPLRPSAAARAVPGASPRIRAAASAPDEISVDNRLLHGALRAACAAEGVAFRAAAVDGAAALEGLPGDAVIICAGADSGSLVAGLGVRPVKGEVVRLRRGPTCLPPPAVTVRARVRGRQVYVVPRADGVVVGATQYENDHDLGVRIGPVVELLDDAFAVLPFLREYEFVEVAAGLRPTTASNVPVIAPLGGRVFAATGHGRNGLLLAPVTGARVADMVLKQEVQAWS
ncbi:glycine oxidase ThiO [Tsukamurella ocularis]|uniref:glycine oxidase ThiO n=1 Tax=Tsukamurella ocularis TaxID=1970234 RepID=UPI00216A26E0|nr:glycine oxidase ThiO [Tsukamurella ocularis]MCS3778826.1 glycine oxidase [Tsukamurella ocularis]MCS3787554.1 glycine oxidase [Tsukamurella ocularis]MCS3851509.1 glycine oxidase [Tsukamurella ocularis]